jgi:3-dehydroquinate synthase
MDTLTVHTHAGNYNVHIGAGLLDCAGELSLARCTPGPAMVVADSNVAPLYAERVETSLRRAGFTPELHVFPAGEASKSAEELLALLRHMARSRMTRSSTVFALGGGVTGDLAGLAASLYMRGVRLVQLPTTLLAAVDSSVGGKTAVDLEEGKNLVGTFYQPCLVLCDTSTFSTLPERQTANGFGEIIKTGMIRDEHLFSLASRAEARQHIKEIVSRCVEIKKSVVERDERETGLRQILNFGHTFGHAIEKCSGYTIPHGFCVAAGMALITAACAKRGICSSETISQLCTALKNNGLPTGTDYNGEELYDAMMSDKKRAAASITLILPLAVGRVERRTVSLDEARSFLRDGLSASAEGSR